MERMWGGGRVWDGEEVGMGGGMWGSGVVGVCGGEILGCGVKSVGGVEERGMGCGAMLWGDLMAWGVWGDGDMGMEVALSAGGEMRWGEKG